MPKGGGSGRVMAILALIVVGVWAFSGVYRVQPDEEGVVLRFGAYDRKALPGLNYHLPWPIESALTPRVTTENLVFVGFRSADPSTPRAAVARDVLEESLMLTGDENIIDIDFAVCWRIADAARFPVQHPQPRGDHQVRRRKRHARGHWPYADPARADRGARADRDPGGGRHAGDPGPVRGRRGDHPGAVAEGRSAARRSSRHSATCSGPRPTRKALQNEAQAYRNDIIPRARGEAERMIQEAQGFRDSQEARARGEATRFLAVLQAYRQAEDITMRRMYLETMEEILRSNPKVIVDDRLQGLVPFLNLGDQQQAAPGARQQQGTSPAVMAPQLPNGQRPTGTQR